MKTVSIKTVIRRLREAHFYHYTERHGHVWRHRRYGLKRYWLSVDEEKLIPDVASVEEAAAMDAHLVLAEDECLAKRYRCLGHNGVSVESNHDQAV